MLEQRETRQLPLETRSLTKAYKNKLGSVVDVLAGIDLNIAPNEFVTIVGPSGCGKTTFIRILHGLIEPTAGEVLIDGEVISGPGPDRGFVFQADALFPWRTVKDNVALGLELKGVDRPERNEIALSYLKLVGLGGFEDYFPHEISGGMRQRVNLARALAIQPQILLLDEPFAALDAQTRELMQRELLRIWGVDKRTVVFVTHQIEEAVILADRVLVFSGRPAHVKEEINVALPRPRTLRMKRTAEFLSYTEQIWDLIEVEDPDRAE